MPKVVSRCISLSVISADPFFFLIGKKYYPKVFLEEFKIYCKVKPDECISDKIRIDV